MNPIALLALASLLSAALPAGSEALRPREVVARTASEVIEVLRDEKVGLSDRQRRIEEIASERFDFETIGQLVLARHWRGLSDPEKSQFLAEFQRYLALNYGSRIDRYQEETVEVLDEREEPRGDVTVRTRVVGGNADGTSVDYRLRNRNGRWRVIDVVVEGISAVRSFRSQFQEVLKNAGAPGLIAELRTKNDERAAATTPTPEEAGAPAPQPEAEDAGEAPATPEVSG